jgi:iron complex outermembrane receptor protein
MKYFFTTGIILLYSFHVPVLSQSRIDSSLLNYPVDSAYALDAVTVEAYHVSSGIRTIPGGLSVLRIKNSLVSDETNLTGLLNSIPGISMQSGTYTTNRIVIRGMGSRTPYNTNRIKTYFNDIPLTGADGLSSPEEIDLQGIARVEVIKGPASALYGSGLGGTLNIYTPSDLEKSQKIMLQFGSFSTLKAGLTTIFPFQKSVFRTTVNHLQSQGYRDNSEYRRTSVLSAFDTEIKKWKSSILLMVTGVKSGIPSSLGKTLFLNDPASAAQNWKAVNGYKQFARGMGGITVQKTLSSQISNKLIVFGRFTDSYEKRPFNNLDDLSVAAGFRNKLFFRFKKADWIIGLELVHDRYSWKLDTSGYQINHNREMRNQANAFSILYFRPSEKFNVSFAGAINYISYKLIDMFDDNGDQSGNKHFPVIFSPRIGINYSPGNQVAFYASAGHGFSLPSPEETLLPAGDVNHDLRHENGWQFEAGSRINIIHNTVSLDATLYWIELNDLLVTKRITEDIFTGVNAGKTRHAGVELSVKTYILRSAKFPGIIQSSLAFTRSLNRFLKFEDDGRVYNNNELPGIPDQVFTAQIEWNPFKNIELYTDLLYNGRQYLNDSNTERYESYLLGNLKIIADIISVNNSKISMYAGINNYGNTAYASMLIVNATGFNGSEPRYYYPGLPRHFYFGIRISFD